MGVMTACRGELLFGGARTRRGDVGGAGAGAGVIAAREIQLSSKMEKQITKSSP